MTDNTNDELFIAIDLDDVVADFMGYAHHVLAGKPLENGYRFPDNDWKKLKDNPRMYQFLPRKDGANELVEWCQNYCFTNNGELAFLTAMPRNGDVRYAFYDKVHWVDKYFPGIPVYFGPRSEDKYKFCNGHNSILIDDRKSNCDQWIAAGGRAHQYKNWEDCKVWLEQELQNVES
jgi:hypothetical protein